MNTKILTAIYVKSVKAILLAIPVLTLFISNSMFFPYITGRNFGFRLMIEFALVLWAGLLALRKEYRPKKGIVLYAVLAFTAVIGLADLFGVNPYLSFWSRYERMEGYMLILHLAAYFIMLTTVMKTRRDWKKVFGFYIVIGVIVGIYGLLQITINRSTLQAEGIFKGLVKLLGVRPALQGGQRIDGTIGNPTYLAAYLLMLVFVSLSFFTKAISKIGRWLYGISALFFAVLIFLSATRGALLALGLSAVLMPIFYLVISRGDNKPEKKWRKIAVGIIVLTALSGSSFWAFRGTALVKNNYVLSRLANISLTEKTTRSRFMVWNISLQGFKEHPILGWGQENYTGVFAKYYNPKLFDQEPWFDRSHNIALDWLVSGGILGLLAYLGLFASAVYVLWRLVRAKKIDAKEGAVLAVGLIAYFFQNFFVFDNLATYITFFGILAYINTSGELATEEVAISTSKDTASSRSLLVAGGALLVLSYVAYAGNIKPIMESRDLIGILATLGSNSPDAVSAKFKNVLNYNTFGNAEVLEQFGRLGIDLIPTDKIPPAAKVGYVNTAVEAMERHLERFPLDIRMRMAIITLYNRSASLNPNFVGKARRHADEAIRQGPNRQQAYFASAENYLLIGNFDAAIKDLKTAINLEPRYADAHLNLAIIAANIGREDLADEALASLLKINPGSGNAYVRIGTIYLRTGKNDRAFAMYKKALEIEPNNPEFHANAAAFYIQRGEKQKAIAEARKAAELDPLNYGPKAEEFIKSLK